MTDRHSCDEPFEVVFVCTANRARSALAEALFRRDASGIDAIVRSAGTLGAESTPALEEAIAAGRRLGVDLTQHRAQPLRHGDLAPADLIIGFEQQHVAAAVVEGGAHPGRTFLLGEVGPLLRSEAPDAGPCSRARLLVAQADSRRVRTRPAPSTTLITDPYGKSARVMDRTANEIERLVRQLVEGLFEIDIVGRERRRLFRRGPRRGS